jgi:hypothetical protein
MKHSQKRYPILLLLAQLFEIESNELQLKTRIGSDISAASVTTFEKFAT